MAIIQSGASATEWTIDPGSFAGRVTLYDSNGNEIAGVNVAAIDSKVMSALTEVAEITLSGQANCSVQLLGTTGSLTISFQASINDGYSWFSVNGSSLTTELTFSSVTADGVWFIDVSGYTNVRCIVSSYISGSTNVSMVAVPQERSPSSTPITGSVTSNQGNPNSLGLAWPVELTDGYFVLGTSSHPVHVTVDGYVQTNPNVFITNFPATYAVTQSTSPWVSNVTQFGSNNVVTGTGTSGLGIPRVTVSNDSNVLATQSGTWTVQPGNTANTTPWLTTINQGGNSATVTGANALKVDGSAVTQPVSGTVTANAGTGNFTVVQATASNLRTQTSSESATGAAGPANTTYVGGSVTTAAPTYTTGQMDPLSLTTAGALRVDGSGVTQPISGTVTANIGTTNGLALDTSVNGILLTQGSSTSGEKGPLVQGAVTTTSPAYSSGQTSPFSLTTLGALRVDGSAVTQPVSGTITANQGGAPWSENVTQFGGTNVSTGTGTGGAGIPRVTVSNDSNILATQSGTWTVQPGNTANTTPWLVTDSSDGPVTPGTVAGKSSLIGGQFNTALPTLTNTQQSAIQLDSSGRVLIGAIPTGANVIGAVTQSGTWTDTVTQATAANLNATVVGTTAAGSGASTGLFTIQGNAGGTPVPVTGTLTTSTDGYATTSAPTYTNNTFQPLSLTTTGLLRVDGSAVTQPVSGTVAVTQSTSPWVSNITQFGSTNVSTGTGAGGAGIPRVTVSNDSNVLATQSGTWTATVTQATAANLNATVVGTVTANIGTTNGLALDTSVNGILVTQGSSTSGEKGPLIQGAVTTAAPTYTTGQTDPISLTTAGAVRVDGSGVTQPVSGTVAATQSGTWTVQPGNTANTTPWLATINQGGNSAAVTGANALKVDGSAVTQPVSGTITANAGTGNFTVVQATAANLNATVVASGNFNNASVSATAAAGPGSATYVGGAVTTAAPTYTTGQMDPLSLTTAGALRVDGSAVTQPVSGTVTANIGTTNGLALDTSVNGIIVSQGSTTTGEKGPLIQGAVTTAAPTYTTAQTSPLSLTTAGALRIDGSATTQPISGTVTANQGGAPWAENVTQFGGTNVSTGTGAGGAGIPRVTVSNDSNVLATQSGTWTVQPGNTANTTPWLTTINQGSNSAAVKAASTAAVATDPALVVAISPNNSISVGPVTVSQSDITGTGTLNALNAAATITALAGAAGIGMQLLAGTLVGTIVPEISNDGGTSWVASFFEDPITGNKASSIVFGSANTATTRMIITSGGLSSVRVRVSAFTSGTATCNLRASTQVDTAAVLFDGAAGSPLPPTAVQIGGSVTTTAPTYTTGTFNTISLDTVGNVRTLSSITDGTNGTVAVKPASTASVAADPALVVTISPNSLGPAINAAVNSLGTAVSVSGSVINGITNLNVVDANTQNRLDLLYARIDDLVNLLTMYGVVNKPSAVRSFVSNAISFAASTSAVTLLSTNSTRTGAMIVNDSGSANNLYILFGAGYQNTVSTTNYSARLRPGDYYEVPFGFSGRIDGIWSGTSGNVYITEMTNATI